MSKSGSNCGNTAKQPGNILNQPNLGRENPPNHLKKEVIVNQKYVYKIAKYISEYIGGSDAYDEETTPDEVMHQIAEYERRWKCSDVLEAAMWYLIGIIEGEQLPAKSKLIAWEILHAIELPHRVIRYYMVEKMLVLGEKIK